MSEQNKEPEPSDGELLDDAIALCHRLKADRRVWNGDVGLSQNRREDINDLISRYNAQRGKQA